jgi:GNAT superfamily N-acetyltransferase
MDQVAWEWTDAPSPADAATVNAGLEEFNCRAADMTAVRPLACFARSQSGELIGGALARTWGRCCELRQLWVAEPYRRRGIGRRLVQLIEQQARARQCTLLFLDTFSFQSPALYRALGFEIACEFAGFPDGIVKYFMRKDLTEAEESDRGLR